MGYWQSKIQSLCSHHFPMSALLSPHNSLSHSLIYFSNSLLHSSLPHSLLSTSFFHQPTCPIAHFPLSSITWMLTPSLICSSTHLRSSHNLLSSHPIVCSASPLPILSHNNSSTPATTYVSCNHLTHLSWPALTWKLLVPSLELVALILTCSPSLPTCSFLDHPSHTLPLTPSSLPH